MKQLMLSKSFPTIMSGCIFRLGLKLFVCLIKNSSLSMKSVQTKALIKTSSQSRTLNVVSLGDLLLCHILFQTMNTETTKRHRLLELISGSSRRSHFLPKFSLTSTRLARTRSVSWRSVAHYDCNSGHTSELEPVTKRITAAGL